MEDIPFVSFGNDELEAAIDLKKDDTIVCPHCTKFHKVKCGIDTKTGKETDTLLFYNCGEKTYLAGVNGKKV